MERLFHYTTASRLKKILADELIKHATAHIGRGEKPAVWLSFRQDWEPTATPAMMVEGKVKQLTFSDLAEVDTPARIEINPAAAPLDWDQWCNASGVLADTARALKQVAVEQSSSVTDWRISFDAIGLEHWLAIEVFVKGQWVDCATVFGVKE